MIGKNKINMSRVLHFAPDITLFMLDDLIS